MCLPKNKKLTVLSILMSKGEFVPDNGNFYICLYCTNLIVGKTRNSVDYDLTGCKLRKDERGKYIQLGNTLLEGSEDFTPSGLSAHPRVLKELVKTNPKCSTIPSDEEATEIGYEFSDKVKKYLSQENIKGIRDFQ
jgi:hypothetical protein